MITCSGCGKDIRVTPDSIRRVRQGPKLLSTLVVRCWRCGHDNTAAHKGELQTWENIKDSGLEIDK